MKKQSGPALVVVLSLLTVSLMVGLSSMQSSQVDERLAGNYKAQSVAQMAAETGASQSIEKLSQAVMDGLNLAGVTEGSSSLGVEFAP